MHHTAYIGTESSKMPINPIKYTCRAFQKGKNESNVFT